jgi:hypothetical protein
MDEDVSFELWATDHLFRFLQSNMETLRGILNTLLGNEPYPDPRLLADSISAMSLEDFMGFARVGKDEFLSNLDILELSAKIAYENNQILKVLVERA